MSDEFSIRDMIYVNITLPIMRRLDFECSEPIELSEKWIRKIIYISNIIKCNFFYIVFKPAIQSWKYDSFWSDDHIVSLYTVKFIPSRESHKDENSHHQNKSHSGAYRLIESKKNNNDSNNNRWKKDSTHLISGTYRWWTRKMQDFFVNVLSFKRHVWPIWHTIN